MGPADEELHERYEAIFEGIEAPFAFVDLDALAANADAMLARGAGKPIRVASKSVRCREVLERIDALDERFCGLLCFTLPEALMLAAAGRRDIVVAYPTVDRRAISRLGELAADPEATPVLMVDETAQLDLIEGAATGPAPIPVAIDIDAGYRALRGAFTAGTKRSPIRTAPAARRFAEEIASRPGLELVGLMAYEGQVAGVGDATPGHPLRNVAIRHMQRASMAEIAERRAAIAAAVGAVAPLRFVNGGGTGSLELTAREDAVTELAAGSGFYAPALFDAYGRFSLRPAAGFALPIVRRPAPGCVTALGGGYVASGPAGEDRLPQPWLPPGLHLDRQEGAGEVQTPLLGEAAVRIRVGDRVYMRHAKAGELCERFDRLHLVSGEEIVAEVPTYRGEGHAFL
ncbi:MAG: amino acid deaminase/aldolase [Acidobacteria bacterium]|nr:MAG: amino acid deaminase/aldolase [Acidobacteriota bacterium]MCL4287170.1 alanine racemase [Thermoleophilia bacterium]GIK78878.1 MAG: alanine racemase [Actinomycetes bacterium]